MKGSSLACAAACVFALFSGGADAAGVVITPAPHVGPARRPPPPGYPLHSRSERGDRGRYANANGAGWRYAQSYGQGARYSRNSGSGFGDSDGIYIPEAQPTPDAAWAPATALILDVATNVSGAGDTGASAEPSNGGPHIIYINRDPAANAPAGDGPTVIYGVGPAGGPKGPQILYGDSPN